MRWSVVPPGAEIANVTCGAGRATWSRWASSRTPSVSANVAAAAATTRRRGVIASVIACRSRGGAARRARPLVVRGRGLRRVLRRRRVVLGRLALERGVEAGLQRRDVRERGQEVHVVAVHAVAQRQLLAALVGRDQVAAEDAQLDVDDVVAEPPTVREAGVVAADDPEAVLGVRRR